MEECCLCSRSIGIGSSKKKRKKLHGKRCSVTRGVLERLADELAGEGGTKRLAEVMGPHAFLCSVCEGKLRSIAKHEKQLRALRAEIDTLLQSALHPNTERELAGRKRCSDDATTPTLMRKAPGLDIQPCLPGQGQRQCVYPEQLVHLDLPSSSEETPYTSSVIQEQSSASHHQISPASLEQSPTSHHQPSPASLEQSPTSQEQQTSLQQSPISQKQPTSLQESPAVTVTIGYPSGQKIFKVTTPARKHSVKRLARHSYKSLVSSMMKCSSTSTKIVSQIAQKIKAEMKDISSQHHDSVLLDTLESVKKFSWETVLLEFQNTMPTLMHLLMKLVINPSKKKPLLCLLASQLLKQRYPKLGLVQRAMSVLLYGNGTKKQVYRCLQPLMVCMSYNGTIKMIDRLCQDHDIDVLFWGDELKSKLDERIATRNMPHVHDSLMAADFTDPDKHSTDDSSVPAPTYSPLTVSSNCSEVLHDDFEYDSEDEESFCSAEEQVDPIVLIEDEESSEQCLGRWCGFKIIGDNIDKNVRPSHQRLDRQTQSLHYFHSFAVRDRIDLSSYSDLAPTIPPTIYPTTITPTASDLASFQRECEILVSRILVQHMPVFKEQATEVVWHIPNKYAQQMAEKSTVIPLGVILHDENRLDEMSKIMEILHKYVPTRASEGQLTLPNGSTLPYDNTIFFEILLGGDQLTVARVSGVQNLRIGHETALDRLEGLIPVVEDWHARVILLEVLWKRLYSSKSVMDKGTMYQLKNLINRSVPSDPSDNVKAAEDFLLLLIHAHVLAAARFLYSLNNTTSVCDLAKSVVATYLQLPQLDTKTTSAIPDGVHAYALDFLSLSLLWVGFHDAIKEGDGDRIILYWKLLLVVFKSANRPNYGKEAVKLLLQQKHILSERKRMQLMWSRFVNTKGRIGCNIPCDLHMEHLNRRIKTVLHNLGSNVNPTSISRAGKSLEAVHNICKTFELETSGKTITDYHPYPEFGKDLEKVVEILEEVKVFVPQQNRWHPTFPQLKHVLLQKLPHKELLAKVKATIDKMLYSM